MMYSPRLKKILIVLVVSFLILSVGLYFGLTYIINYGKRIATLNHQLLVQNARQEYITSSKATVVTMDQDLTRINNSIIPSDGDVSFIEKIELIAKKDSVDIAIDSLALQSNPTLDGGGVAILKIKAQVKGSWDGVHLFMSHMESLPYEVRVNRINFLDTKNTTNLDPKKTTASSGQWQGEIEMDVLKYK